MGEPFAIIHHGFFELGDETSSVIHFVKVGSVGCEPRGVALTDLSAQLRFITGLSCHSTPVAPATVQSQPKHVTPESSWIPWKFKSLRQLPHSLALLLSHARLQHGMGKCLLMRGDGGSAEERSLEERPAPWEPSTEGSRGAFLTCKHRQLPGPICSH